MRRAPGIEKRVVLELIRGAAMPAAIRNKAERDLPGKSGGIDSSAAKC
jgi:hypothetical protein